MTEIIKGKSKKALAEAANQVHTAYVVQNDARSNIS